ncbi:MAG TPA: hypothetical protein VGS61_07185 [Acidimicrobiales bacterium]|nr:hypothetical protein [Acidimicrobiales bacterium]
MSDATPPKRAPDAVDAALGALDHALDVVHDKVLRPLIIAGRAVAFGLIIALAALVLAVALVLGLTRLLTVYLFAGHVWITDGVSGALFVAAGMVVWRRRRPAREA